MGEWSIREAFMEEVAEESKPERWIGFQKVRGRDNAEISLRVAHHIGPSSGHRLCGLSRSIPLSL